MTICNRDPGQQFLEQTDQPICSKEMASLYAALNFREPNEQFVLVITIRR